MTYGILRLIAGFAPPSRLLRALLFLLIGTCFAAALPAGDAHAAIAASSPSPGTAALTPADAGQLLSVLNDPAKLAALKITLVNLQKAMPNNAPPQASAGLPRNSLAAQLLANMDEVSAGLAAEGRDVGQTLRAFRYAEPWFGSITRDPARRKIESALVRLAVMLGTAFVVSSLLNQPVQRPISTLARMAGYQPPIPEDEEDQGRTDEQLGQAAPPAESGSIALGATEAEENRTRKRHHIAYTRMLHALMRVPFGVAHFMLELVPIAGFVLVAFLFELTGFVGSKENLVVVQSALDAFVIGGVLMAAVYTFLAPEHPTLRLVPVSDVVAKRVTFWLWLMVLIGASGFAILNVMATLGLPDYAGSVAEKLLVLVEHTLLAVLILRSRADVSRRLQPPPQAHAPSRDFLRRLARTWWVIAIFFDYALWLVWAAQLKNGYSRLLISAVETAIVAAAARLLMVALLGGLARLLRADPNAAGQHPWYIRRTGYYYPLLRRFAVVFVLAIATIALFEAWGFQAFSWFRAGAVGGRLMSVVTSALVALVAGIVVWEAANIGLERHVDRLSHNPVGSAARLARVRTLMPILRIILFTFITTVFVMTILSEIGVNIAPLLGGAGIIGVAIGFGSQKLVQDFITGIFLLLENTMQVGDSVTLAGMSGTVERLSIRTIHLRAGDGSLQIIPFSSVTTLTNSNRGLGNAPVAVNISPEEDTDRVADVLKTIVTEIRADPAFGTGMLSDLQYWGVDKVTTQAVTLVGQIVCTDAARYNVQREFNRRMKKRFDELGIKLAQPSQTVQLTGMPDTHTEQGGGIIPSGDDHPSAVVKESPSSRALGHGCGSDRAPRPPGRPTRPA
jgi:moderate conductance mechanosensitive channel